MIIRESLSLSNTLCTRDNIITFTIGLLGREDETAKQALHHLSITVHYDFFCNNGVISTNKTFPPYFKLLGVHSSHAKGKCLKSRTVDSRDSTFI